MTKSWQAWLTFLYDFWQFQKSHFVICSLYGGDRLMTKGVHAQASYYFCHVPVKEEVQILARILGQWWFKWFRSSNSFEKKLPLLTKKTQLICSIPLNIHFFVSMVFLIPSSKVHQMPMLSDAKPIETS